MKYHRLLLIVLFCLLERFAVGKTTRRSSTQKPKRGQHDDTVEEDNEKDASNKSGKERMSKILGGKLSPAKKAFRLIKKRPVASIVSVLVLYKWHKEILMILHRLVCDEVYDPSSGEVVIRSVRIEKLAQVALMLYMAKTLLFSNDENENDDEEEASASDAFLMHSAGFPRSLVWTSFLRSKHNKKKNPAFVPKPVQHYTFESLNDRYTKDQWALEKALGHSNFTVAKPKTAEESSTILVLDWTDLDTRVSSLPVLRDQVSFLLSLRHSIKEVVILLSSPGGAASEYAVAAAQVRRLRAVSDTVTVCVDTVAASGGYMIAVAGTRIVAAPFAVVGSIGVIGQLINIHKLLETWGIAPLVFRGGSHKAPVGMIGEVTEDAIGKVQDMIDITHMAFQRHVKDCRPQTTDFMDRIGNGDVVLGWDAMALGMVDRVVTSDEYLQERLEEGARVLKLRSVQRGGWFGRPTVVGAEASVMSQVYRRFGTRLQRAVSAMFDADLFTVATAAASTQSAYCS